MDTGGRFESSAARDEHEERGKAIITRLRAGQLPQMVDWFDPGLLAKVGIRSVISATLGSYTDQRLIQASTDNASEARLKDRYNFSGVGVVSSGQTTSPSVALPSEPDGSVWIDYLADLGDGFEATYAMAYLLAADTLTVNGVAQPLPAGRLLLMGGDQVYPDATKQEYHERLRDPYDWAFHTADPQRKLFAIPGNHDWYDGLSAFSALFCSSRDRISGGIGAQIGGWRCYQHRSYFAIKLPHNWWIWGPDIQLADNLDDSQRDYFDLMADQTQPGDNIILCLAEPSWLHKNYDNMHEISMLARKKGAKICAVIAGDWHHYSRYTNSNLGTQFITSGGGGAFAHSTHGLKPRIELKWASPTGGVRSENPGDSAEFNRSEKSVIGPGGPDFTQQKVELSAKEAAPEAGPIGRRLKAIRKEDIKSAAYMLHAPHIYPSPWKSRLLSLRNLWLPFHNRRFGVLVGIVYFIFAWVWAASDPRQSPITLKLSASIGAEAARAETSLKQMDTKIASLNEQLKQITTDPIALASGRDLKIKDEIAEIEAAKVTTKEDLDSIWARKRAVDGDSEQKFAERLAAKVKAIEADKTMSAGNKAIAMFWQVLAGLAVTGLEYVLNANAFLAAAENSPMFAFLLIGLWAGLVWYVELPSTWLGTIGKLTLGSIHFLSHIVALLVISLIATSTSQPVVGVAGLMVADPLVQNVLGIIWKFSLTLFLGGLIGGFVMGLYWTTTCALFNMHTGDAFGALGLKDYKHFLRIKLEPGRATIYPIAIDKVPGRRGWRWQLNPGEKRPAHNPQILPVKPLEPKLIEREPIVIEAANVKP